MTGIAISDTYKADHNTKICLIFLKTQTNFVAPRANT